MNRIQTIDPWPLQSVVRRTTVVAAHTARWRCLAVLTWLMTCGFPSSAWSEELTGRVTDVSQPGAPTVKLDGRQLPRVGDSLEVFVKIPGVGPAVVASGKVATVNASQIVIRIEKATGQVTVGQSVRIQSDQPTRLDTARVPVLIGRTAAAARAAVEAAGFVAVFQIGVDAPPNVQPQVVYDQSPQFNTQLATGRTITVTLYGPAGPSSSGRMPTDVSGLPANPTSRPASTSSPPTSSTPAASTPTTDPRDTRLATATTVQTGDTWWGIAEWTDEDLVMILGTLSDGPAARAGLQAGDAILEIDGRRVHRGRIPRIYQMLTAHRAGDRLAVKFRRNGQEQTTTVECGQLPRDGGHGRIAAAAEAGEAWAMADLGLRLSGGVSHGVKLATSELDRAAGRQWLERSRAAGHAAAALMLASLPAEGLSSDAARAATIETLQKARQLARRSLDDPVYLTATRKLAEILVAGARSAGGNSADGQQAVELYTDLANLGVTDAAYQLALLYENGRGVSENQKQSLEWYQRAARDGHHTSQTKLGMVAYYGQGVKQNYETARAWFELAAQKNNAYALTFLGIMHRDGQATARDPAAALSWFEKATRNSFLNTTAGLAYFQAGQTYEAFAEELGLSPTAARARAIYQYRKGFVNDDARAALQRLGVSHEIPSIEGWGEIQDPNGDCQIEAQQGPAGDTAVRMTVPAGEHDIYSQQKLYGRRLAAPRVMREVHGDFVAEVWVTADWALGPAAKGQGGRGAARYRTNARGAGLLIYASDHEYVRHERMHYRHAVNGTENVFVPPIYDRDQQRISTVKIEPASFFQGRSTLLRLERRGDILTTAISHDGETWQQTNTVETTLPQFVQVGVHAINVSDSEFSVLFQDFRLEKTETSP